MLMKLINLNKKPFGQQHAKYLGIKAINVCKFI